jgi:hypothetical protein
MNDEVGGRSKKKYFKRLILVAALGGLFLLLHHIGWEKVLAYSGRLGWLGLFLLLSFALAESCLDAFALWLAVRKHAGFFSCLAINSAGGLTNKIIPLETGEVLKAGLMTQKSAARTAVSGVILWNYIFKLSKPTAILTAALAVFLIGDMPNRELSWAILGASLLSFLPFIGIHMIIRSGPASATLKLLNRLRLLRRESFDLLIHDAQFIDTTIRHFRKRELLVFLKIFGLQYFARLMDWLSLCVALNMMDPALGYSFFLCGAIYVGFNILSYLLLILPTRIGTAEGGGYVIFSLYGLNPSLGVLVQLILGIVKVIVNLIPALFLLLGSLQNKKSERQA